jgi:hypothetical protein
VAPKKGAKSGKEAGETSKVAEAATKEKEAIAAKEAVILVLVGAPHRS